VVETKYTRLDESFNCFAMADLHGCLIDSKVTTCKRYKFEVMCSTKGVDTQKTL